MKYMLLIYDNADTRDLFFGPEGEALSTEIDGLMGELRASGELVGALRARLSAWLGSRR